MLKLEAAFLAGQEAQVGLINVLKESPGAFCSKNASLWMTRAYAGILVLLPIVAAFLVGGRLPAN